MLVGQSDRVVALEGQPSGEHLVEGDAHRVDVGLGHHALALGLLGREIVGGAERLPGLREAQVGYALGDAEVGHLHPAVVGDEHVLGLDIAVDEAAAVGIFEARQYLGADRDGLLYRQGGVAGDELFEALPRYELHDDIVEVAVLAYVVDVDDVGMGEVGGCLGFAAEACHKLLVCGELVAQHFDRHDATQDVVAGFIDLGHASAAHHADEGVAAIQHATGIATASVSVARASRII